jgi:low temperature requirement protein LtrA
MSQAVETKTSPRGRFWERPRLRADTGEHRRVGWLELFYDLAFVVVISQMAHHLSEHLDVKGVLEFIATFIPVWWVWIGGMYYAERFETSDFSFRLFTFLQMLPVAGLALTATHAFDGGWQGFAGTYIFARLIIIFLWWRGARHDPRFAPTAVRYNTGFIISSILWSISLFAPLPLAVGLAGLGLMCDLIAPWTTINTQSALPPISRSHLPERFGLFVMITLGEALLGTINGVAATESLRFGVLIEGLLGMLLVFSVWWIYFDFVQRRIPHGNFRALLIWNYLHLPLVIGIAASSAGVLAAIAAEGATMPDAARWLVAAASAVQLTAIGLLEYTLGRGFDEPTHHHGSSLLKFAGALMCLLIAVVGAGWSTSAVLLSVFSASLVQMGYGIWVWYTRYPDSRGSGVLEKSRSETTL